MEELNQLSSSTDPMVLYGDFLKLEEDEFIFKMARDDVDSQLTFSQEALHQIVESFRVFLGARIVRRFEDSGIAPKQMAVHVKVMLG